MCDARQVGPENVNNYQKIKLQMQAANAKNIEGGFELSVPVSRSRITWLINLTCYTQNPGCSDFCQSIPLFFCKRKLKRKFICSILIVRDVNFCN